MPPVEIVLPGLINTHTHAPMVLYRGLADDLPLMEWLNNYIFPAEAKTVSPEFVRARRQARGARDDRIGHDDLRGHVYSSRRRSRAKHVAPACVAFLARRSSSSQWRTRKHPPIVWRAPRPSSPRSRERPAHHRPSRRTPSTRWMVQTLRAARELSRRHNVPTLHSSRGIERRNQGR